MGDVVINDVDVPGVEPGLEALEVTETTLPSDALETTDLNVKPLLFDLRIPDELITCLAEQIPRTTATSRSNDQMLVVAEKQVAPQLLEAVLNAFSSQHNQKVAVIEYYGVGTMARSYWIAIGDQNAILKLKAIESLGVSPTPGKNSPQELDFVAIDHRVLLVDAQKVAKLLGTILSEDGQLIGIIKQRFMALNLLECIRDRSVDLKDVTLALKELYLEMYAQGLALWDLKGDGLYVLESAYEGQPLSERLRIGDTNALETVEEIRMLEKKKGKKFLADDPSVDAEYFAMEVTEELTTKAA